MWRSRGIDSGVFSRSLMLSAKNAVLYGQVDVLNVLNDAADTVEENGIQGSSTCCLVLVDTLQGRLTSANVGDSGFVIIGSSQTNRKPHVKFHAPQQEHTFGFPYQLGHQVNADKPHDAMLANIPLLPGDVLIMGSDGLWDNVDDNEILDLVLTVNAEQAGPRPMAVAQSLARAAFYNSLDKKKVTPYSLGATEAFDMVFNGGKQDDITVVVATFSGEVIPGRLEGMGRHGL
jgi:protein phosphatase PTC7